MILICENCGKEYEYKEGQLNWGKNEPHNGKGSVNAKKYCCFKCGKEAYKKHCKETNLKRYGCENPFQVEQFKEKSKQTCLSHYGVDNSMKSKDIQRKSQETCLKHYGKKFPGQLKECWNKRKQTCLKEYGVEHPAQNQKVQEKIKNTKLEKYGDENYNNLSKAKQTMLEKYGVEWASQIDFAKEKSKQTCLDKYGVKFSFQSDNNKSKAKQTKLVKYGDENYHNIDKAKQTNLEKYGNKNPLCCEGIKKKAKNTMITKYGVEYYVLSKEFEKKAHESKKRNDSYGKSKEEEKINELLNKKFSKIERQYKSRLYPFFCDFYISELNLYIEYQGYWSHGKQPFNESNEEHLTILHTWEDKMKTKNSSYANAIEVWTIRDPLKRETARKNNLNWLEFFTLDEFMKWYNNI